jgi:hypothetical protein
MLRAIDEARRLAGDVQAGDTNAISLYRAATGVRASAQIPAPAERNVTGPVSVAQLLDSANMALPDPATFKEYEYKSGLQAEYIARPSIGYSPDNFGRSVFGGTTLVFSDLLGNNRLAVSAAINGRLSEGYFFAGYTNLSRRNQYTFGAAQEPIFILTDFDEEPVGTGASAIFADRYEISRYITRRAFAGATYPLNRFTRFEYGLQLASFSRSIAYGTQYVDYTAGIASQFQYDSIVDLSTQNYAAPFAAYVFDNTLFGYTGPISGRRYRFGIEPIVGNLRWIDYSADFRHYFPILFNFLTFAYRGQASISAGRDEFVFPKYIGASSSARNCVADCSEAMTTAARPNFSGVASRSRTSSCDSPWCAASSWGCCPSHCLRSMDCSSSTPASPGAVVRTSPSASRTTTTTKSSATCCAATGPGFG